VYLKTSFPYSKTFFPESHGMMTLLFLHLDPAGVEAAIPIMCLALASDPGGTHVQSMRLVPWQMCCF
jgi:hypothetical protein